MKNVYASRITSIGTILLVLTGGILQCRAEPSPPLGEEILPPDEGEAIRQGFELVNWNRIPKTECEAIRRQIVAPLRERNGHREPFGIECATAFVSGSKATGGKVPDTLVLAHGAGSDLNDSELEGNRLMVFEALDMQASAWRLVLSTQAQAVGLKRGEIASIQASGIVRYRWNGSAFKAAPAYDNTRWMASLDLTRDGFRRRTRVHVSPGEEPPPGMPFGGNRVSAECEVTNLKTGNVVVYRGTGRALMRQDTLGGDVGKPLGSFELWLPGQGGYKDGNLNFADPRCASGIPSFQNER